MVVAAEEVAPRVFVELAAAEVEETTRARRAMEPRADRMGPSMFWDGTNLPIVRNETLLTPIP